MCTNYNKNINFDIDLSIVLTRGTWCGLRLKDGTTIPFSMIQILKMAKDLYLIECVSTPFWDTVFITCLRTSVDRVLSMRKKLQSKLDPLSYCYKSLTFWLLRHNFRLWILNRFHFRWWGNETHKFHRVHCFPSRHMLQRWSQRHSSVETSGSQQRSVN